MGIFKSNKDKESVMNKKDEIAKASYKIVIKEKLGSSLRTVRDFTAVRFIDEEDHVVYLKSDAQSFLEIFPESVSDFNVLSEKEIDKRLAITKHTYNEQQKLDEPTLNVKNLEFDLLKLNAKKRSFKFSRNASYITWDDKGLPTFYFLRQGSTFIPMKWDADTSTIYIPSDNKKKSAAISLRNKQNKYITKDKAMQYSFFMIVAAGILLALSAFIMFKAYSTYEEAEITQARLSCLTDTKAINQEIRATAGEVKGIAESLNEQINKPQTVIEGVAPR